MQNLVTLKNGTPVIDSVAIAEGVQVGHHAIIQIVRKYINDFNEFGGVAFEMQPFATAGGTQKREIALLNENQAMLLFTFLKNSEIARQLKVRIVKAFAECRAELARQKPASQHEIPQTYAGALRLAADLADKALAMQAQIEKDRPKVEFYESCGNIKGMFLGSEAAVFLHVNRSLFFNWCFNHGIIQRRNKKWFSMKIARDKKWCFDVLQTGTSPKNAENYDSNQLYFTPLGIRHIHSEMRKEGILGVPEQLELFETAA